MYHRSPSLVQNDDEENEELDVERRLMSDGIHVRRFSSSPTNGAVNQLYNTMTVDNVLPPDVEDDCGCGPCRPKFLQRFNHPKCLLTWLSVAAFAQGMVVNGLINVVITTIELRFHLSSSETGLIASTYDITSLICLLPVSYFGAVGYRGRWLAVGSVLLGLGNLLFTLPHFLSEYYDTAQAMENHCITNASHVESFTTKPCSSPLSRYQYIFITAQVLHGAGAAPLYTLGVAFLDDSVKPKLSSLYVGIYYAFAMLGPACGFLLGGHFLTLYVDFNRVASWSIKPNSPAWIGAWWLGFLGTGCVSLLTSIPLFLFPPMLPRAIEYRLQRKNETHADVVDTVTTHTTLTGNIHAFPKAMKVLLLNRTYIFLNLAGAADAFVALGLATYGPKVFQSLFGFSASMASIVIGAASIPFGAGGTLLGGYLVKRFSMGCSEIIRLCVICSSLALLCTLIFLVKCPNAKFAGVNVPYESRKIGRRDDCIESVQKLVGLLDSGSSPFPGMSAACNEKCSCSVERFDPVCSTESDTAYMTPCHAGCTDYLHEDGSAEFFQCSCIGISHNKTMPVAKKTACSTSCSSRHWLFIVFFALLILFTFLSSIPAVTATLRCVADNQRPMAMGVQWIIVRLLGSVPGPLCFGTIIDTVCMYWQQEPCGSGRGRCLSYDNNNLSNAVFAVGIVGKCICTAFFFLAWWSYKPAVGKLSTLTTNPSDVPLSRYNASNTVSVQSLDDSRFG